jgi:hypothetical protein
VSTSLNAVIGGNQPHGTNEVAVGHNVLVQQPTVLPVVAPGAAYLTSGSQNAPAPVGAHPTVNTGLNTVGGGNQPHGTNGIAGSHNVSVQQPKVLLVVRSW